MAARSAAQNLQVTPRRFPAEDGPEDALLLVEGSDDFHLLCRFIEIHKLNHRCTLIEGTGIKDLLKDFNLRLRLGDVRQIGIVIDADVSAQSRWDSVKSVLAKNGYANVATSPLDKNGTLIEQPDLPKVGVWIMPDNQNTGMVEDFVATLIPLGDALWPLAEGCVDAIPAAIRRFSPAHVTKAKIRTWLAWQKKPGIPMGLALREKYLDAQAPPAVALAAWMRQLFMPTLE